jgi:quercetin dioxygenase-like cupin family protein
MQNSNTLPLDAEITTEYTSIHAIADNNPTAPMQVGFTTDLAELPHEGGVDPAFGTITWRTLISGENGRSDGVVLGVATCGPNGCLHLHRHDPAEFYLGLSGSGTVTIDGVAHEIRQGIAVYIPGNAEHGVVARAEGLSFVYGFGEKTFSAIEYRFS